MTAKELSQLYWLNREIEQEKQRLAELEAAATNTASKITGLPHVTGISDKTGIAAQIADAKNIIQKKTKLSVIEYSRLNRYIEGVEDSYIRNIMVKRHVKMMSWPEIAGELNTTEGSVKMAYWRYLRNH